MSQTAYEDTTTEACLTEGGYYTGMITGVGDWLFDEARAEGDITVVYDESGRKYIVVEFIKRYYDEANDAGISSLIAEQEVSIYLNEKLMGYDVVDVKGDLKYLTLSDEEETVTE